MDVYSDFRRRAFPYLAMLFAAFLLLMALLPQKALPSVSSLNGVYTNTCCGSFALTDGRIRIGNRSRPFVLEYDKVGLYVLPDKFVGVTSGSVGFDSGFALKLRLNNDDAPTSIQLWDKERSTTYEFAKKP